MTKSTRLLTSGLLLAVLATLASFALPNFARAVNLVDLGPNVPIPGPFDIFQLNY